MPSIVLFFQVMGAMIALPVVDPSNGSADDARSEIHNADRLNVDRTGFN